MRQIGTLASENQAISFSDYLLSQKIQARLDKTPEGFEVWIYDENQLGQAREALQKFQANPTAAEFQEASKQAARLRSEKEKELKKEIQQYKQTRNAWRPPQPTDLPITMLLIIASVVITLAISLEENSYGLRTDLSITRFEPAGNDMIRFQRGLPDIRAGEVWRLITPIFIHFGPLHLFMNMWITYQFGSLLEPYMRWWRYLIFLLFTAITSNLVQYVVGGPTFGGMSGVDFAMFGFLWIKGVYEPERGLGLRQDFVYFMLGFLVLCFTGIFGSIANGAHVMGLISGCLAAGIRPAWNALRRMAS